jgi:large subunit ribosomal protein L30
MGEKVKVTLLRSRIKADSKQRRVLDGLNLRKRHQTRELEDTPAIRGMIAKVTHMVAVEEA